VFGGVLAHSGAYGVHSPALAELARAAGPRAPAVWIDVGAFEEDLNGRDLLAENRRLRDALTAIGLRVRYLEVPEGHSWGSWRARKREALEFLLGAMGGPARRPSFRPGRQSIGGSFSVQRVPTAGGVSRFNSRSSK
jgi:enterochelin esterase-like enzyme